MDERRWGFPWMGRKLSQTCWFRFCLRLKVLLFLIVRQIWISWLAISSTWVLLSNGLADWVVRIIDHMTSRFYRCDSYHVWRLSSNSISQRCCQTINKAGFSRCFLVGYTTSIKQALVDKLLLLQDHSIKFFFLGVYYALIVLNQLSHALVYTLRY